MEDEVTTIDDGGDAFPIASDVIGHAEGMKLRDYFAAQALPAVIEIAFADPADAFASREQAAKRGKTPFAAAADMAYEFANAMVARKQQP